MPITTKGRVTIPAASRRRAGLLPSTDVRIVFDGREVVIEPFARRVPAASGRPTAARESSRICEATAATWR
jgi:bifunctional DNA-binding transcriptional regulator/antitoxin component of YhaV-PrlF toxin-antitoxin module